MSLFSMFKSAGPTGFGYGSTAEQVTGRANGTLRLDLSKVVGIEGAMIYSGSICSLVSRTPFDTIVKAFT
jgi:hypothetical protein